MQAFYSAWQLNFREFVRIRKAAALSRRPSRRPAWASLFSDFNRICLKAITFIGEQYITTIHRAGFAGALMQRIGRFLYNHRILVDMSLIHRYLMEL